jgi:MFS family permease
LRRAEWWLTALAAVVWGLFNAGYVVYLSFAPKVLMTRGFSGTDAAAVISLASWVMVFSVTLVGRLADRTGRHATVLGLCLAVGAASLWWLPMGLEPVVASLAFGLIGAAPAGIIMALTAQAMAPERRAFGMGVFYSLYFVFMAIAPPVAGWLFDRSARADLALWFGAALFVATGVGYAAFAPLRRRLSPG